MAEATFKSDKSLRRFMKAAKDGLSELTPILMVFVLHGMALTILAVGLYGSTSTITLPSGARLVDFVFYFATSSLALHAVLIGSLFLNIHASDYRGYVKSIVGVLALSLAISLLLVADKPSSSPRPEGMWTVLYTLITERQALLTLALFTLVAAVIGTYKLLRSIVTVEYTGAAFQVRLPGMTTYTIPIYPQLSWQSTDINVTEGESLIVELSGYACPGALQDLHVLDEIKKKTNEWIRQKQADPGQWTEIQPEVPPRWRWTDPGGYNPVWYTEGPHMLEAFKNHPTLSKNDSYEHDKELTVRGKPHNRVIGYIQSKNDPEPTTYVWSKDARNLIDLSENWRRKIVIPDRSGKLWVVINDFDNPELGRWDNGGLFFMRVTRSTWF